MALSAHFWKQPSNSFHLDENRGGLFAFGLKNLPFYLLFSTAYYMKQEPPFCDSLVWEQNRYIESIADHSVDQVELNLKLVWWEIGNTVPDQNYKIIFKCKRSPTQHPNICSFCIAGYDWLQQNKYLYWNFFFVIEFYSYATCM